MIISSGPPEDMSSLTEDGYEPTTGNYLRSLRQLINSSNTSATVIKVVYLVTVGCCILIPFWGYLRRKRRRLARIERLRQSEGRDALAIDSSPEETSAERKRLRREKRARIRQLLEPVTVELKEKHFSVADTEGKERFFVADNNDSAAANQVDEELGEVKSDLSTQGTESEDSKTKSSNGLSVSGECSVPFIELPVPGLPQHLQQDSLSCRCEQGMRLVPNYCAVCLASYEAGDKVVWSSNPSCEHAFHEDCIRRWLFKRWEDPQCPCCRKEFTIDPLDME